MLQNIFIDLSWNDLVYGFSRLWVYLVTYVWFTWTRLSTLYFICGCFLTNNSVIRYHFTSVGRWCFDRVRLIELCNPSICLSDKPSFTTFKRKQFYGDVIWKMLCSLLKKGGGGETFLTMLTTRYPMLRHIPFPNGLFSDNKVALFLH